MESFNLSIICHFGDIHSVFCGVRHRSWTTLCILSAPGGHLYEIGCFYLFIVVLGFVVLSLFLFCLFFEQFCSFFIRFCAISGDFCSIFYRFCSFFMGFCSIRHLLEITS